MAAVKRKRTNQKSHQRKTRCNQTKRKKPQANQRRKTTPKQIMKHVKTNHGRMSSSTAKGRQLTKKAKGVLSSCVEGLCQEIFSKANCLRKKIHEPTISHEVLLAALEQSMAKETVRRSLTPGTKKTKKKKQSPVDTIQKMPSRPTEKQAAPTKMLPKPRKQPASPVFHECS